MFNPVGSLSLFAAEKGSLEEIRRPPFSHKQVLWRLSALAWAMSWFLPLEIAPLGAGGPGAPADQPASDVEASEEQAAEEQASDSASARLKFN